ncbi:hypothetical protein OSTOST_12407 [Ostertagia ostertagi]
MKWDYGVSGFAFTEAFRKGSFDATMKAGWTQIRKEKLFRWNDTRSLEEKVNSTLEAVSRKKGEKVKNIRYYPIYSGYTMDICNKCVVERRQLSPFHDS